MDRTGQIWKLTDGSIIWVIRLLPFKHGSKYEAFFLYDAEPNECNNIDLFYETPDYEWEKYASWERLL